MIVTVRTRMVDGRHEVSLTLTGERDDDAECMQIARDAAGLMGISAREDVVLGEVTVALRYRDEARAEALVTDLSAIHRIEIERTGLSNGVAAKERL